MVTGNVIIFIVFQSKNRESYMAAVICIPALLTLVTYVDALNYATKCPNGCACSLTTSDTRLTVDCDHISTDVDLDQLSRQLDSVLSTEYLVQHLTSVVITHTPLTRVPTFVCQLLNLNSLNLDRNKFTHLPDNCFTKLTKLVKFSAEHNAIDGLQDGLFDGLQRLVTLDLLYNNIAFIGLHVFSNASDLTSLRVLSLGQNRLTSLEPWWYYRCILGSEASPVHIDLSSNLITNFTNVLQFDFRCGMQAPFGFLNLHHNRIQHIMDLFHSWNIDFYKSWACLANLQLSHPRMKFNLGGSHYDCDCTDYLFYKWISLFPRIGLLNDVRCAGSNFQSSVGATMLATSIPLSQFVCKILDRCPYGCQCVYRPANVTLHVYCSAANLSSLPLELPLLPKSYVKYKLDFSSNKLLGRLEHHSYFVNTSILDVSNCSLAEIGLDVWQDISHMKVVNFQENMLQSVPKHSNISTKILLGGNPYHCSCDNSWMIGWFQSFSHRISDMGNILCMSPSRMYGRVILKVTEEEFCVDPVKRVLTITLSTVLPILACLVFLVVTGLLFYKLRVKFYKKWKFHPFDRDECVGEDMDYDVFLCCSSEDDDPHAQHIIQLLESNSYHVCYHERDFLPGQRILDNIGCAIERSKRIVCLLSENFIHR